MIKLSYDMPADQRLPIALKRLSVLCKVQIGSAGSGGATLSFKHPIIDGIALLDTGSSMCTIGSRMIPRGSIPVAFHKMAVNVGGQAEEKPVYRCRLMFPGHPTTIELDCIRQDAGGLGCDLVLGTPFLSLGRLIYDAARGDSHFSIHPK